MAQTGFTPISLYYSNNTGNAPTAGQLVSGELALNAADGKLFYKDNLGVVQFFSANVATSVSTFSGGATGLTPASATSGPVTLAGTLATTNGGTGLTSFTSGGAVYASSTSALTTGTLPVTAGGTGVATIPANAVLIGNGTSAVSTVAPGTAGNLLTSDGTNWVSQAIAVSKTPSGYTTLPNGLIIQWGGTGGSTGSTITFPIAFPTQLASILVNMNFTTGQYGFCSLVGTSLTTFTYENRDATGTPFSAANCWIAIGY